MKPWIIGNWKQNPKTFTEAQSLIHQLMHKASEHQLANCQMMVIPSSIHLAKVADIINAQSRAANAASEHSENNVISNPILVGAQDISALSQHSGAYTGDCSAAQIKDSGADWVLIGHSERRQYYQEGDTPLQKKLQNALSEHLGVIFCVGETEAEHDAGDTLKVIQEQLTVLQSVLTSSTQTSLVGDLDLSNSGQNLAERLIIAYEPVWAIGTGKVPTVEEVAQTHLAIKEWMRGFNSVFVDPIVIYGGSVNADNAVQFAQAQGVDGALIGGASLQAESFLAIADAFTAHS